MRLPREIEELELVGGALAIDFVNTADSATPEGPITDDHIGSFESLLAWAEKVDLLDPPAADRFLEGARR